MTTISLLQTLIETPSTIFTGTNKVMDILEDYFRTLGSYETQRFDANGTSNFIASISKGTGKTVVFNCHMDTIDIEPTDFYPNPYLSTTLGNKVYGLGAVNCKGPAVSHLLAARLLIESKFTGNVVFSFVGDEETFGINGSKYLKDEGFLNPDYLIVAAPTSGKIIRQERGVLIFKISANGKKAHAGNPDLGKNALDKLMLIIDKLKSTNVLLPSKTSTFNLGIIDTTNKSPNSVPDFATATFDCRYDGISAEEFSLNIKNIVESLDGKFDVQVLTPYFETATNSKIISVLSSLIDEDDKFVFSIGSSDCRHFIECNEKVSFGPGDGNLGHSLSEVIDCTEIEKNAEICIKLVLGLLDD